jgi:hypothetical protein
MEPATDSDNTCDSGDCKGRGCLKGDHKNRIAMIKTFYNNLFLFYKKKRQKSASAVSV